MDERLARAIASYSAAGLHVVASNPPTRDCTVGVFTGTPSGGFEAIEVQDRTLIAAFEANLKAECPTILKYVVRVARPNEVCYLYRSTVWGPSAVLAFGPAPNTTADRNQSVAVIKKLGDSGFVLVPPTPGLHASTGWASLGKQMPTLDPSYRAILITTAQNLSR